MKCRFVLAINASFRQSKGMANGYKKVRWKAILFTWDALSVSEKLVALAILARSDGKGWANLDYGQLRNDCNIKDNRTIKEALGKIKKLGALQEAPSTLKRKRLYRLHYSQAVKVKPVKNKA
jgi:hypothetical protein